jgi:hypothetical protein
MAQWVQVADQPTAFSYVAGKNVNSFTITINNKCQAQTVTLGNLPGSSAITTYSGAQQIVPAITYSLSDNTNPCSGYVTVLVQVSSDGGTTWFSTGNVYSNLLSSENTNLNLILAPATSAFDSGTTNYSRLVKVSVKSRYGSQVA